MVQHLFPVLVNHNCWVATVLPVFLLPQAPFVDPLMLIQTDVKSKVLS